MSIWTCDRGRGRAALGRGLALGALLLLVACLEGAGGPGTIARSKMFQQVAMADGEVVLVAPRGYCIDSKGLKTGKGGGFALLAPCAALSNGESGEAVDPAILTVTVLPRQTDITLPKASELEAALAPTKVLAREERAGLTLLHVANGGDRVTPSGDPRHWRAALLINHHPVAIALYGPRGGRIAGAAGRALILAQAEALRAASPAVEAEK